MQHLNLVNKYNRAKSHFEKGNFRRAKWLFDSIVFELMNSDTDSMGDINLNNSAEDYLEKIKEKDLSISKIYLLGIPALVVGIIIYLILK